VIPTRPSAADAGTARCALRDRTEALPLPLARGNLIRVGAAVCGRPLMPSGGLLAFHTDTCARSHRPGSSGPTTVGARDGEGAS